MNSSLVVIICVLALTFHSAAVVLENDVTFYLFTKENREDYIRIDSGNANVNRDDVIVFLVHGWMQSRSDGWYDDLKNAFLSRQDKNYTVIQVDWKRPASQFYPAALGDSFTVGDILADFITNLIRNKSIPAANLHLCGHSLGAHVVAFAAKTLTKRSLRVPRITALDPAGLFFDSFFVAGKFKLNRRDADVVVVVHTDGGLLGFKSACGTVDFYPNGGTGVQPGCPDNAGGSWLSCSHERSHQFFINALENPGTFIGTECGNYQAFLAGDCFGNKQLDLGGDITINDNGEYYLTTNPKKPYGQGRRCDKQA